MYGWLVEVDVSLYDTVAVKSFEIVFPTVMRGASKFAPANVGSIWKRSSRKKLFVRLVTAWVARLAISSRAAFATDSSDERDPVPPPTGDPVMVFEGSSPVAMRETIWASERRGSDVKRGTSRVGVPERPIPI